MLEVVEDGVVRPRQCLLAIAAVLAVLSGCSGRTTGVSNVTKEADGAYSAKLNATGSCDRGSSSTPCTAYMRWREVGTDAWTNGRPLKAEGKVDDYPWAQTATGLSPNQEYEYQACGREFTAKHVRCAGPDGTPETTERFSTTAAASEPGNAPARDEPTPTGTHANAEGAVQTTPEGGDEGTAGSAAEGTGENPGKNTAGQNTADRARAASAPDTASRPDPAGNASKESESDGGSFPLVVIGIALGALALVLGAAWAWWEGYAPAIAYGWRARDDYGRDERETR
jgi:hypothetical protein